MSRRAGQGQQLGLEEIGRLILVGTGILLVILWK